MTQHAQIRWTVANLRSAVELRNAASAHVAEWGAVFPGNLRAAFVVSLRDQAWDTLAAQARAEIAARRADLSEMAELQQRLNERFRMCAEFAILFADAKDARKQAKAMTKSAESQALGLDAMARNQLAAWMGATLALAVARFNQHDRADLGKATATTCSRLERQLAAAKRAVYDALRANDLLATRVQADMLASTASSLLYAEALQPAAALAAKRRGADPYASGDGRLAVRFGDLIRSLLESVGLGQWLSWLARWHPTATSIVAWTQAAQTLPLPSAYQAPLATTIAALAADPIARDGQELIVEGLVGQVAIVHRGRKAISTAPLVDARERSIMLALPYIKLDSGGLVPGAYARIAGRWQAQSPESGGRPALLIGRLALGELGKQSWSDWASKQVAPVFEAVPHHLAAGFSWELGTDGAGNPLRYGVWFDENA